MGKRPGTTHRTLKLPLKIAIASRLDEVLTRKGDLCEYPFGSGDAAVAREMTQKLGVEITGSNVRTVRVQLFGDLVGTEPALPLGPDTSQLANRVSFQDTQIRAVIDRLDKLNADFYEDHQRVLTWAGRFAKLHERVLVLEGAIIGPTPEKST